MNHPDVAKPENVKVEGAMIIGCGIKSQLHACAHMYSHTCIHTCKCATVLK